MSGDIDSAVEMVVTVIFLAVVTMPVPVVLKQFGIVAVH